MSAARSKPLDFSGLAPNTGLDDDGPDREPTIDHAEIEARREAVREEHLRRTAPNIVRDDPAEAARAEAARLAECERRQRRAEIEARLRKLPFSPIDPASPPAVAVAVQPKPVTTITTLREPRPMTDPVAVTPPSIGDGVPADLPSVTGASPANVRRVWAAARDLAAEGEPATGKAVESRSGVSRAVVLKVSAGLRKAGRWPAPPAPAGRPRKEAGTPPGVPRAPRPAPEPRTSTPAAPDRVLGHPGGLPGDPIQAPSYYVTPDGLEWGDCWRRFRGRDAAVESALAQIGQYTVRCGRKPGVPAIEDARKIVTWGQMLVSLLEEEP